MAESRIVILDFGSQYTQVIARRIRECQVYSQIVKFDTSAAEIKKMGVSGIILSGGPASVYSKNAPQIDKGVFKLGLPIQIWNSSGSERIAATTVNFISPHADEQTQSLLVKGAVKNPDGTLRSSQYVQARIVWKTTNGLVVPVTAVLRVNGQFFAFVAEESGGKLTAKQRPIKVGAIIALIVFGGAALFGFHPLSDNDHHPFLFENFNTSGGLFPNGFSGVLVTALAVFYAFSGSELIGVAAGETARPASHHRLPVCWPGYRIAPA